MTNVPQDARLEIKFIADVTRHHSLLHKLRTHRFGFSVAYPPRQVNNIYFDNYDFDTYQASTAGISERTKIRYRWYGPSLLPAAGALEIKCKRNTFGWKFQYGVLRDPSQSGATWPAIKQDIERQIPLEGAQWLRLYPWPVLLNRYQRDYYVSRDQQVRVTLDSKLAAWDQRFKSRPNLQNKSNLPALVVLEVKSHRRHEAWAQELINELPLRISQHSKYVAAMGNLL